mmetsp:Transcript_40165/g.98695  ORF Transcript_40165/g.98695 Transcript_40165/m.98695 type:complete len:280 (+) Transcript_40165:3-842(+)
MKLLLLVLLAAAVVGQDDGPGDAVEVLEEREADPEPREVVTASKLIQAAGIGDSWEVERLLDLGVPVDAFDEEDPEIGNALMRACTMDRDSVITVLIRRGADVLLRDSDGRRPLVIAASAGKWRAVTALLQASAYQNTAPDAVSAGNVTLPINERDELGRSAFLLACLMGQLDVVRALSDNAKDLDVDLADLQGRTPLMWAVTSKGGVPLVQLLLDRGASTTAEDNVQATALTWALERGNKDVIEVVAKYTYGVDSVELKPGLNRKKNHAPINMKPREL